MDEVIIRVDRVIASFPRLDILLLLSRKQEMNAKALAKELKMPLNALCAHLRALLTVGLVQRRKSGTWCYYRFESPYGDETLSGKLAAWLKDMLAAPESSAKRLGVHEVRDASSRAPSALFRTIFEAATAFTDLRRLQILRYLVQHGTATTEELRDELSMSKQAVSRHAAKLKRRGYVQMRKDPSGMLVLRLAEEFKTPIHAKMFEIVRSVWQMKASRSS